MAENSIGPAQIPSIIEQILGIIGDWSWCYCTVPPPQFHPLSGVWKAAAGVGGGRRAGERHCPLLHWSSGGCLCHRTQPSGCHSLSKKQSRSAGLPLCLRPAEFSLSGPCRWAVSSSEPGSPPRSSQARLLCLTLPLTLTHSLPLFLKSFCLSHMPMLSLTGSFSLFPPLFLPAFGLSPQPCQELATPLPNLPALINPA